VPFAFDPKKDHRNRRDHGISLARMDDIDADTTIAEPDLRADYGEARWRLLGFIDNRLYQAAVTFDPPRVFSLRPASRTEQEDYHHAFTKPSRR
jgi:uncharacterized protein